MRESRWQREHHSRSGTQREKCFAPSPCTADRIVACLLTVIILALALSLWAEHATALETPAVSFTWQTAPDFITNASTTGHSASLSGLALDEDGEGLVMTGASIVDVAAGSSHTIALRADGTPVVAGPGVWGSADVESWSEIRCVSTNMYQSLGVREDGTVVAAGSNIYGECDVAGWTDIVDAVAGQRTSVGLRSDGTVVVAGDNTDGQHNVSGWTGITAVAAGVRNTFGLRQDGTVVYTASGTDGWLSGTVGTWEDVVSISAGHFQLVGLMGDGSVRVARMISGRGEETVLWTGMARAVSGSNSVLGLTSTGTAVLATQGGAQIYFDPWAISAVDGWQDVVEISAGSNHYVGLRADGTLVSYGSDYGGKSDVDFHRHGTLGGATVTGLQAAASDVLRRWRSLDASVSTLSGDQAVKFAVKVSDDGMSWSPLLGRDGRPIDWSTSYFGTASTDTAWYGDLSCIPSKRYLDAVVRLESGGPASPQLHRLTATAEPDLAPAALNDFLECQEDQGLDLDLLANDTEPNGDPLVVALLASPGNGKIVDVSGRLVYLPNTNFVGVDTFTYRAWDGRHYSSPATVTVSVTRFNASPSCQSSTARVVAERPHSVPAPGLLSFSWDQDGEPLTIADHTPATSGFVSVRADGAWIYTPAPGFSGVDTFSYRVRDAESVSEWATVYIVVDPAVVTAPLSTAVTYGTAITLSGRVIASAEALPAAVRLEASEDGRQFVDTGVTVMSDAAGAFRVSVKPSARTSYRFRFADGDPSAASVSAVSLVQVRPRLSSPVAPTTMVRSRNYRIYGTISPKVSTAPIRVYKYRRVRGAWRSYGYSVARSVQYSGYSRYFIDLRLREPGRWRLRAYVPATKTHMATWSGYDYIDVR